MANSDLAIPIVFPDYLISVDTPAINVQVPNGLPWFDVLPDRIRIPSGRKKLPYLGHAGILFANGQSGVTRYFEYGRYDPAAHGLVRRVAVPDFTMGTNGHPTSASLKNVLEAVSRKAGQGGKISGAYIELESGAFDRMQNYAAGRMSHNSDPGRPKYELLSNSCLHFMKETAAAGGAWMPPVAAPQPAGYIVLVRMIHRDLDFSPGRNPSVANLPLQ